MSGIVKIADLPWDGVTLERGEHRDQWGSRVETLHVISRNAGGQIRGYQRRDGEAWKVWLPAHEGHWPEMDRAVADAIGEPLIGLDGKEVGPRVTRDPPEAVVPGGER